MQRLQFSSLQINELAKSYSPLATKEQLLRALSALPAIDHRDFKSKFEVHKKFNELLLENYVGELTIKHFLFNEFAKQNVTAAFEIRVNSSRVDFLAINGDSKSFEIKSSLDNLQKLKKQSNDYARAFEFNFVVVDEKHVKKSIEILPPHYGVWSYNRCSKQVFRVASSSTHLDPEFQLTLLTKRELEMGFKEFGGIRSTIINLLSPVEINERFKAFLKLRYAKRWAFLRKNSKQILPIDIPFFFATSLSPDLVYQRGLA